MVVATVVFLPVLGCILAFYLKQTGVPRPIWHLAFVAFALRASYVLLDSVVGIYAGGGDQSGYEVTFWFVAEQWRSGVVLAPLQYGASPGNSGYYMLLYSTVFSPVYAIFGRIAVLPRLQMALVGTLVVINVYLISHHIYNYRAGLIAGAITTVFPYWVILSGIIYRDMLVIFLFTAMVYFLVRWQSGERNSTILVLLCATAVLALSLRLQNAIAVGVLFAAVAFSSGRKNIWEYLAILGAGSLALVFMYFRFKNKLLINKLAGRRLWLARENPGAYLTGFAYESLPELIAFAPIGALHFALVPFPWHTIDLLAMIAIGQNLILWYPVLLFSLVGLRDILNVESGMEMVVPFLVFSLVGIFGYGLVEGNIGPAMRHRSQFQFSFFVLAGVAIANRIRIKVPPFDSAQFRSPSRASPDE